MGAFDWSVSPAANATADLNVSVADGASARDLPGLIRSVMAAQAALLADQGGAIRTGGLANAYLARTASGIKRMRPGIALLVQADRDNTGSPTLNVDSMGARPWRDLDGSPPPPGRIKAGAFYLAIANGGVWTTDFGALARAEADNSAITAALIFGGP